MLVVCSPEQEYLLAPMLADVEGWQIVRDHPNAVALAATSGLYLAFSDGALRLCLARKQGVIDSKGCALEFAELRRRSRGPTELIKACLPNGRGDGIKILDAFAGWGMDAWQLALRGADVECWESNAVVAALLRDAWRRAPAPLQDSVWVSCGDAFSRLRGGSVVDVVYLDPMFPPHRTRALPNKRLQYLTMLVAQGSANTPMAGDAELIGLIGAAQQRASTRVVLKRRRNDAACGTPAWQVKGTSVRYDIYHGQAERAGSASSAVKGA